MVAAQAQAARARRLLEEAREDNYPPSPPQEVGIPLGQPSQLTQDNGHAISQLSQDQLRHYVLARPNGRPQSPTQATVLASQLSQNSESHAFAELEAHLRQLPSQTQQSAQSAQAQPQQHPTTNSQTQQSAQSAQAQPQQRPTTNGRSNGRSSGARNYTEEERLNFLNIVEQRLPVSGTEWALVAREHSESYPNRDVASLKRQYQALLRRREPTGDPKCPPDVKRAKHIDRLLKAKQSAGDVSEEAGGPLQALAALEVVAGSSERLSDADSVRPPPLQAGHVLAQKRTPSKTAGSQSVIESMLAMQVMAQQTAAAERAETRKREREEREEARREREEERKDQR